MSHPVVWRCRACKRPLGVVCSDGALEPQASRIRLGADGIAHIMCPTCGTERRWVPTSIDAGRGLRTATMDRAK